jgi:hypothetical protein
MAGRGRPLAGRWQPGELSTWPHCRTLSVVPEACLLIDADRIHRTRANRTFWQRHRNRMGGARLDRPRSDPKCVEEEKGQSLDGQPGDHAVSDNVAQEKQRDEWGLIHKQLAATKQSTI